MKQKIVYWIVNNDKKKFKAGMFSYDKILYLNHETAELNICYEHKNPEIGLNADGYTMFIASDSDPKEAAENQVNLLYRVFASLGYFPDNDIVIYKRSHKQGYEVSRRTQKINSIYFGFQFPLSELNDLRYLLFNYVKDTSVVKISDE